MYVNLPNSLDGWSGRTLADYQSLYEIQHKFRLSEERQRVARYLTISYLVPQDGNPSDALF
jgi:hypothetical protein